MEESPSAPAPLAWPGRIEILDETEDWLVVNKPSGLLMHPTNPKPAATLWDELRRLLSYELAAGGQISFVNRLDRETSGIVLIAKNRETAREFTRAMKAGEFQKTYHALVWGWPEWEEHEIDQPMLRAGSVGPSAIHLKQAVHSSGAVAFTRVKVLARRSCACGLPGKFALLEAHPRTGRTHQIRVHLAFMGHPIVGDKIYGPDEQCYLRFIEHGWTEELQDKLLLPHHALHASKLSWQKMQWTSPLPQLFNIGHDQPSSLPRRDPALSRRETDRGDHQF